MVLVVPGGDCHGAQGHNISFYAAPNGCLGNAGLRLLPPLSPVYIFYVCHDFMYFFHFALSFTGAAQRKKTIYRFLAYHKQCRSLIDFRVPILVTIERLCQVSGRRAQSSSLLSGGIKCDGSEVFPEFWVQAKCLFRLLLTSWTSDISSSNQDDATVNGGIFRRLRSSSISMIKGFSVRFLFFAFYWKCSASVMSFARFSRGRGGCFIHIYRFFGAFSFSLWHGKHIFPIDFNWTPPHPNPFRSHARFPCFLSASGESLSLRLFVVVVDIIFLWGWERRTRRRSGSGRLCMWRMAADNSRVEKCFTCASAFWGRAPEMITCRIWPDDLSIAVPHSLALHTHRWLINY